MELWPDHLDGADKLSNGIWSWTQVEFLIPLTFILKLRYNLMVTIKHRWEEYGVERMWNYFVLCSPYLQYATPKTYRYLNYFSRKIFSRNCPAVGWVQGKYFWVDVFVEILHLIHMNFRIASYLGKTIIYLIIIPIFWTQDRPLISKLVGAIHGQHMSFSIY